MNYKDLNKIQKDRMKQISVHDYIMEWENPEFMDYLLGSLPQIRGMKDDESITDELSKLNNSDENKSILSLLFFFKFNIGFLILVCFLISIIRDLYSSKQEN